MYVGSPKLFFSIDHLLAFLFRSLYCIQIKYTCAEFNWNVVFLDGKKKKKKRNKRMKEGTNVSTKDRKG